MNIRNWWIILGLIGAVGVLSLQSCRYSEVYYEGNDAMLDVSRDTVRFDTVFTTIGSATRSFKIYNPFDQTINLSKVALENPSNSFFRLNVNGRNGNEIDNVEIPGKDSIYIFAEVTIDPDAPISTSPYIIEEYVNFEVNGNKQKVLLEAWGQNANYVPSSSNKGGFALLSCDLGTITWDDPKPYVIYGILLIDSCTLELPADCHVYVHGGIAIRDDLGTYNDGRILVLKDGRIMANGTVDQPVIIEGDRLEPEYEDVAAQWTGIQLLEESKGNTFRHTIIKDGIIGMSVDSAANVTLDAVEISNHSSRSLIGFHAEYIHATNSLFHSTLEETVLIKYGGDIQIDYSTITGYSDENAALYADNYRCTQELFCGPILVNPLSLKMRNTLISGNGSDELQMIDGSFGELPDVLSFEMEHCIIKMDTLLNSNNYPNFFDNCIGCASVKTSENLFVDQGNKDFHLDTLSQAEMQAIPITGIFNDIEGNARDGSAPDVGCYEYQ